MDFLPAFAATVAAAPAPAESSSNLMLVLPLVLLAVMMFFMWRSNKRNREKQQEIRESMTTGVEVMTQAGIYGTLIEIDNENNVAVIETTPGTRLRVHSATIVNVVQPAIEVPDDASALTGDAAAERTEEPVAERAAEQVEEPVEATDRAEAVEADERDGETDAPKA